MPTSSSRAATSRHLWVESWEEHLRQHGRLTVADLDVEQRAKSMHRGEGPPRVRHLLWAPAALDA